MSAALLEVSELRVDLATTSRSRSPSRSLVGPLDLAIHAGERVALVGPSGAGKSLTLAALLGLLPAGLRASGRARLSGPEVSLARARTQLVRERGRMLTWLPQQAAASLDPVTRVGTQLAEVQRIHGTRDRADELLTAVGLEASVAGRHPHELSGGMAQRVALALALACAPALLLADEPCAALDGPARRDFRELVRDRCHAGNLALLWVSHDLAGVAELCARTLVMVDGRIVEDRPTRELILAPAHPLTAALVAAARRGVPP